MAGKVDFRQGSRLQDMYAMCSLEGLQPRFIAALYFFGYASASFKNRAGHVITYLVYDVPFMHVCLNLTG